jgi:hypothetical protein
MASALNDSTTKTMPPATAVGNFLRIDCILCRPCYQTQHQYGHIGAIPVHPSDGAVLLGPSLPPFFPSRRAEGL